jgi:predicted phage terminase large subunit-like protein
MRYALFLAAALCCCLSSPAPAEPAPIMPDAPNVIWAPNEGPQTEFLAASANEVLYGGAAGGGKSAGVIAAPLRWVDDPNFRALILRRETTQLGNLLDKARALYPAAFPGAKFRAVSSSSGTWRFPSGATVRFNHCKELADAFDYQGDEFQLVAFDELTHFEEAQYREIRSRIRSPKSGLPRYVRATSNPGGKGHEWVFKRWGAWLDPEYAAAGLPERRDPVSGERLPPAAPGQVLWFVPTKDGGERIVPKGTPLALSRTFIPARLEDNPKLLENDPNYEAVLLDTDPVRREQLRNGNWLIKPAKGLYFKRAWFGMTEAAPADAIQRVRYWDLAGSPDGDWAVGVRMSKTREGMFTVEHVERLRGTPGDVRTAVKRTAELDGRGVHVYVEQDPGQAGKDQIQSYATLLNGYVFHGRPKRVDKVTAAGPVLSQVSAGNVKLVRGRWNDAYIAELEAFPEGDHDDQVDGTSGAHAVLSGARRRPTQASSAPRGSARRASSSSPPVARLPPIPDRCCPQRPPRRSSRTSPSPCVSWSDFDSVSRVKRALRTLEDGLFADAARCSST